MLSATYIYPPTARPQRADDNGQQPIHSQNLRLMDKFVQDVKRLYNSKVIALNFSDTQRGQNQINEYIEGETHGKIAGLVKEMEEDTAFALINYIVFQGKVGPPGLESLKEAT